MPWNTWDRLVQKKNKRVPSTEMPTFIARFEGLWIVGTIFAPSVIPRPLKSQTGYVCHPSFTIHNGQYDTKYKESFAAAGWLPPAAPRMLGTAEDEGKSRP